MTSTLIRIRPGRYRNESGSLMIMRAPELNAEKPWVAIWEDMFGVRQRRSARTLAAVRKLVP